MSSSPVTLPTYFVLHGGGPWPWMKGQLNGAHDEHEAALKPMLVISGHWEAREFYVISSPKPPMIYDYSGLPDHTYCITDPAPGSARAAQWVRQLIEEAGFSARPDPLRGFDDRWYNEVRIKSSPGFRSPAEYRRRLGIAVKPVKDFRRSPPQHNFLTAPTTACMRLLDIGRSAAGDGGRFGARFGGQPDCLDHWLHGGGHRGQRGIVPVRHRRPELRLLFRPPRRLPARTVGCRMPEERRPLSLTREAAKLRPSQIPNLHKTIWTTA